MNANCLDYVAEEIRRCGGGGVGGVGFCPWLRRANSCCANGFDVAQRHCGTRWADVLFLG